MDEKTNASDHKDTGRLRSRAGKPPHSRVDTASSQSEDRATDNKESEDTGDAFEETVVPKKPEQSRVVSASDDAANGLSEDDSKPHVEAADRVSEGKSVLGRKGKSPGPADSSKQDLEADPPSPLGGSEPRISDRYELMESFAKGGLGKIWRAHDVQIRREVALKELLPRARRQRDLLERFMAEAQITGQLEHPGIVPIYELGFQQNGAPFYAMKLVRGVTLGEAIRQCHRLPRGSGEQRLAFAKLLRNFIDVCNAVAYAHDHGVLHRDLKPSNVMLGDFGETIVLDWGLAKLFTMKGQDSVDSEEEQDSTFVSLAEFDEFSETFIADLATNAELGDLESGVTGSELHTSPIRSSRERVSTNARTDGSETVVGSIVGTAAYMPPEQAKGEVEQLDQRSDIYSLGAILFEILVNSPPVARGNITETIMRVIHGEIVSPRERDRSIAEELNAICMKALAYDRESRYTISLELAADVEAYLSDEPVSAYREPWHRRILRWMRRHRTLVTNTASASVILALALTAWSITERTRVARLRDQAAGLLANARTYEEKGDLQASRDALSKALASVATESSLSDLRSSIDGQIQSVDRLVDAEESNRLLLLRREADEQYRAAQSANEAGDLPRAQTILAALTASIADEPKAADIGLKARELMDAVEALISEQQVRQAARRRFEQFSRELDQARFYGSLFTAENIDQDMQEARLHATTALKLYGLDENSQLDGPSEFLTHKEADNLRSDALEMMLILADAEKTLARHADVAEQRQAAMKALNWIAKAQNLGVESRVLLTRKAEYLATTGQGEKALAARLSAESTDPSTALDFFLLAEQQRKAQKFEEALRQYRQALRLDPDHFWAMNFMGLCHLQRLRASAAVASYTACISERPDFVWPYVTRAVAFAELEQFDDAMADLARAIEIEPTFYGIYINRGAVHLAQEDFDAAIADFQRARELRDDRAESYINLGEVYRQMADRIRQRDGLEASSSVFEKSLEELTRAAELAPYNPKTLLMRADVAIRLGDTVAAQRDLERAISLQPSERQTAECYRQIGLIHHREDRLKQALAAYDKSLAASDADPNIYQLRGEVLLELRRPQEAIEEYTEYLQRGEPEAKVYRARGLAHAQVGAYNEALGDYTRALELEPSPYMRTRRGWALLLQAAELALDDFEEAIADNPQNPDSYIGRGYAKVLMGDYTGAVADAQEGLIWARKQAASEGADTWPLFHNAASVFAQVVKRVQSDIKLTDDARQKTIKQFTVRAIETIREALEVAGDRKRSLVLQTLKADEAFDSIRSFPEFQEAFPSAGAVSAPDGSRRDPDAKK